MIFFILSLWINPLSIYPFTHSELATLPFCSLKCTGMLQPQELYTVPDVLNLSPSDIHMPLRLIFSKY